MLTEDHGGPGFAIRGADKREAPLPATLACCHLLSDHALVLRLMKPSYPTSLLAAVAISWLSACSKSENPSAPVAPTTTNYPDPRPLLVAALQADIKAKPDRHELLELRRSEQRGGLSPAQTARERALAATADTAFAAIRKVLEMVRIGGNVSEYPGLLALGEISYNDVDRTYRLSIVVDYGHYEDGAHVLPDSRIMVFEPTGTIKRIETIRAAAMATE